MTPVGNHFHKRSHVEPDQANDRNEGIAMQQPMLAVLVASCAVLQLSVATGCTGTAAILRENSGSTAELMASAVAGARDFYRKEADRRLNDYLDILSRDPNCPANSWIPVFPLSQPDKDPFRCLTEAEMLEQRGCPENNSRLCGQIEVIYLSAAGASFQSVLTLIDIVAEYQVRLAGIAKSNRFDTASDLAALRARVEDLKTRIDILRGKSPDKPEKGDDPIEAQLAAVAPLLDILRTSVDDAQALDELRAILTSEGPHLEATLDQLASRYTNVDLQAVRLSDLGKFEKARRAYNRRVANGLTAQDSAENRRVALAKIHQDELALRERLGREDPLSLVLSQLALSHRDLRDAVTNGNLTEDQRQRIAERNIEMLKTAFRTVVGIVKVFS